MFSQMLEGLTSFSNETLRLLARHITLTYQVLCFLQNLTFSTWYGVEWWVQILSQYLELYDYKIVVHLELSKGRRLKIQNLSKSLKVGLSLIILYNSDHVKLASLVEYLTQVGLLVSNVLHGKESLMPGKSCTTRAGGLVWVTCHCSSD